MAPLKVSNIFVIRFKVIPDIDLQEAPQPEAVAKYSNRRDGGINCEIEKNYRFLNRDTIKQGP